VPHHLTGTAAPDNGVAEYDAATTVRFEQTHCRFTARMGSRCSRTDAATSRDPILAFFSYGSSGIGASLPIALRSHSRKRGRTGRTTRQICRVE
jgi:hypothetical protein